LSGEVGEDGGGGLSWSDDTSLEAATTSATASATASAAPRVERKPDGWAEVRAEWAETVAVAGARVAASRVRGVLVNRGVDGDDEEEDRLVIDVRIDDMVVKRREKHKK